MLSDKLNRKSILTSIIIFIRPSSIVKHMPSMKERSWPKPSKESIELLDRHVSRFAAERRQMFGFPCYFVNGNMFAGTFSNALFARLSEKDREKFDREGLGSIFEPVQGRKMMEYRVLSEKVLENQRSLDSWLESSYAYVSSLKPKRKS